MRNLTQSNLIHDFELARRVLLNENNEAKHFTSLRRFVDLFEKKHGWTTEYTLHLHSILINLEDKFYDEKFKIETRED